MFFSFLLNIYSGTFKLNIDTVMFSALDDLPQFNYYSEITPRKSGNTQLAGYVFGNTAQTLIQQDVETYGGVLQPYVDFSDLCIKRNLCKWSLALPVINEYYHPGNGSYSR